MTHQSNALLTTLLLGILAVEAETVTQPAIAASADASAAVLGGIRTLHLDTPYKSAGTPRYWTNKTNSEWLNWGSPTEPEKDFSIGVTRKSHPSQYSGGLRRYLRTNKTLKIGKVSPSADYLKMSVHGGVFEALPFVFRDFSLRKECLGFINKRNNDKVSIYGWMCAPPNVIPTTEALECALAGLSIKGIMSADISPSWCPETDPPKHSL